MKAYPSATGNLSFVVGACAMALVTGFLYVLSFSFGTKGALLFHGILLAFVIFAVSLSNLKATLVFAMIVAIPMGIDYNLIRYPVAFESPPFAEGVTINLVDVCLIGLFFQWFLRCSLQKRADIPSIGHPVGTVFLLWIFLSLAISALVAMKFVYSVFEVVALTQGFLVYFCLVNYTNDTADLKTITYGLFAAQTLDSLWMIGQYLTGLNYTLKMRLVPQRLDEVGFRAMGMAGGDVISMQMIAFVAPVVLAYYLSGRGPARRILALLLLGVLMAAVCCAKNRSGAVAVVVGLLVVVLLGGLRKWVRSSGVLKAVWVLILVVIVASPMVYFRLEQPVGRWWEERFSLIKTAIAMFEDHWVLGVGASNYIFHIDRYVPLQLRYSWKVTVHMEFLLHLAERGVVGAILYYVLMFLVLVRLYRASRSSDQWVSLLSLGLFGGMVGSFVFRLLHWYHQLPSFTFTCVVMALAVCLDRMAQSHETGNGLERRRPSEGETQFRQGVARMT
jgi:hypothetical protein